MNELEARLAERWDRELLAVYADALQATGNPRGELIAIELYVDEHGATEELARRRDELLAKTLGADHRDVVRCRYGWVDVDLSLAQNVRPLGDVIASPFAGYIRDIVAIGGPAIASAARLLTRGTHPWLARLSFEARGVLGPTILDAEASAELAHALPNLEHLELLGSPSVTSFVHPTVRSLRVTGLWALSDLVDHAALPGVVALDLSLPEGRPSVPALRPDRFPGLRRLDLARNAPPDTERTIDMIGFLELEPIVEQLTHLRIPFLGSVAAKQRLDRLVARMPRLVELEFRSHLSELRPDVVVEPLPRCWRSLDRVRSRPPLHVAAGERTFLVDIGEAADVLEAHYRELPESARNGWDTWFNMFLRGQTWGSRRRHVRHPFATSLLRDALAPAIQHFASHAWRDLHAALADAGPQLVYAVWPP